MKLHEHTHSPINLITGYGGGSIRVGAQRFEAPLVLAPTGSPTPWITTRAALDAGALEAIWPLAPRIVLLGAADTDAEDLPALRRLCLAHGAALESMDLGAACRTWNVLAQEDRAVVALLFP
ncbi:MAG: hypothetical protein RL030_1963 [Pseudomonadota bacterium]|jgi:uncharacterized protein